jgi:hypothetical protein
MALGPFAFEAMGFGYDGLQRRTVTPWADIEVAQALNGQQWTGPEREEVTIKGVLFPLEFGGQASLDGIIAAANAGEPLMFVSGGASAGNIYGYFTIHGVEEDRSFIDARGEARRNAYSIKLMRYDGAAPGHSPLGSFLQLFG